MGGTKQKMTNMNKESKILSAEGCVSAALAGADGTVVSSEYGFKSSKW